MVLLPLRDVLDSVWSSAVPLAEKRRLAARAVAMVLLGPAQPDQGRSVAEELLDFEGLLRGIGACAGRLGSKPTVSEAKRWLRGLGEPGGRFASRLGAISKQRNRQAHPDAGMALLDELHVYIERGGALEGSAAVESDSGRDDDRPGLDFWQADEEPVEARFCGAEAEAEQAAQAAAEAPVEEDAQAEGAAEHEKEAAEHKKDELESKQNEGEWGSQPHLEQHRSER